MTTLGYLRAEDRLPDQIAPPGGELDHSLMLGEWFATDHDATGVVKLELALRDHKLYVRAFGANDSPDESDPEPYDWGEIEATTYGDGVTATSAMAFSAVYNFGFMVTVLAAYCKQGILVLDTFNSFTDSSGRSNYFSREFFHR